MRQDWVEFKGAGGALCSLHPEYIYSILEHDGGARIYYDYKITTDDNRGLVTFLDTMEPYEQVKQKIMDAEKVGYDNIVTERFTKIEYILLRNAVLSNIANSLDTPNYSLLINLRDKINGILEETE